MSASSMPGAPSRQSRRTRRAATAIGLASLALMTTAGPAAADPPTNSSFEQPDVASGFQTIPAGSTALTGWDVVSGSVDVVSPTVWAASDGDQSLDLAGSSSGVITQSFPTVAGIGYVISWDAGSNPDCPNPADRTGTFSVQGAAIVAMTRPVSGPEANFAPFSTTFTGTGSPLLLQFADTSAATPGCGVVLDNVNIAEDASVPVVDPEAAAAIGGTVALAGAGWYLVRRLRHHGGGALAG